MKKYFDKIKNICVKNPIGVVLISLCLILIIAGTGVLMASGYTKAIEDIRVGDMVKSYNSATGKVENKRVLQTFENETDELVKVSTSDGQQITSTPGHKYYANNNWISAENLRAGDLLVNVNGEKVTVEKVQHEILESPVKVYNFEVADNHNYFVATNINSHIDTFILVHNRACGGNNVKGTGLGFDDFTKGYDNAVSGTKSLTNYEPSLKNTVYFKQGAKGEVTNISFYNDQGVIVRRVDVVGAPHATGPNGNKAIPHVHGFEDRSYKNFINIREEKYAQEISNDLINKIIKFFKK